MATCKDMHIRTATIDDLLAMNDIYNHYVLHSTSTYQTEPETLDARRAWFSEHDEKHPVIVASDVAGAVLGWGSLSRFHARAAYARTVENSIYVHHHHQRRGIGRALLTELISRACALDHHTIIAGIDADQPASLALHAAGGFTQVARLDEVGHKFGRWLHVIYMQKML
ncbi:GNAT family N-acetyltransferase [Nitrospira sp. KM1]|uniref:GNAT family N-acetyltransferase n=1 Tax=Nitrospira sp. KM1 TaxID=1936990 RepID=UPI0015633553|nr:GNAT family N-acetyltransferase [Nitrospira sp. KM1]